MLVTKVIIGRLRALGVTRVVQQRHSDDSHVAGVRHSRQLCPSTASPSPSWFPPPWLWVEESRREWRSIM